jgi:hypothetical protein
LTLLRKENSDPFDVFAVLIDAKANDMMTLPRRIMMLSTIEEKGQPGPLVFLQLEDSVSFLCNNLTALAQFANIAVAMHSKRSSRSI